MKNKFYLIYILIILISCNKKADSIDDYAGKLFCYIDTNNSENTNYYYITTYTLSKTKENIILNYSYVFGGRGHIDTLVTNINNIYYYMSFSPFDSLYYKAISFNKDKMKVISIPSANMGGGYFHASALPSPSLSDKEFIKFISEYAHTDIYNIDNSDMVSYFSQKVDRFFVNLKNSDDEFTDSETGISFSTPTYKGEEKGYLETYSDALHIEALKYLTGNATK